MPRALEKEGFCGWDPNEDKFALKIKLSTEEYRFALDHKCSNLVFDPTFDGVKERQIVKTIRDDLNTLNNPYYEDKEGKYHLRPVFLLRHPIDLFDANGATYSTDDRIIRNTCKLNLSMPQVLGQKEPLDKMFVYFVKTTGGKWKSYAVKAQFITDANTHEKILITLSDKYGRCRWVKPCKWVYGMEGQKIKGEIQEVKIYGYRAGGEREVEVPSESTELQIKLKHLIGESVRGLGEEVDEPPDFLVWKPNIFDYGRYSERDVDSLDYYNFSLDRTSIFRLFYYDTKYGEEIIKTHIAAAKTSIKEYREKQEQRDKQLKSKF